MPDGMSYADFMGLKPTAAPTSAPSAQSSGPVAFPGGGGALPDGSATQDPAVWSRWLKEGNYDATSTATPGVAPTATPGAGAPNAPANSAGSGPMSYEDFTKGDAPTDPNAGKQTGMLANVGAGTSEATAGMLGMPVDVVAGALNLGSKAVKGVTGYDPGQIQNPVGGSDFFKKAFGVVGANPDDVAPADQVQQIARAGGAGAASMVLPWAAARAVPAMAGVAGAAQKMLGSGSVGTQAAAGAGGSVTGQVAQAAVPDDYKPIANFAGNMLGGAAVLGSVAATRAALDAAGKVAGNFVAPMRSVGQQRLAGRRILHSASDPAAVRETLANPPDQIVPESQPTTYQLTGDSGLGALERGVAAHNSDAFTARIADQNAARQKSLAGLAPENASPEAVGRSFRAHLDHINAFNDASVESARTTARNAVDALGNAVPQGADQQTTALQAFGKRLRSGLSDARAAVKALEKRLWDAVDPDGTLTVGMKKVRDGAKALLAARAKNAAPLKGEAKAIFDTARLQPNVQPFSELVALRSRITDAMSEELSEKGRTQTYGLLSKLLDHVHGAMNAAVESGAAADGAAISSGKMRPGERMVDRLQQMAQEQRDREAATGQSGGSSGLGSGSESGSGVSPRPVSAADRARGAGNPRQGNRGRNQNVASSQATGVVPRAESAVAFLRRQGGVKDESGEFAAMGLRKQVPGLVNNKTGLSHDYAREALVEAGYLPEGSDVTDFRNLMDRIARGHKIYRVDQDVDLLSAQSERDVNKLNSGLRAGASEAVEMAADDMGAHMSSVERDHATELVMRGEHPEEAIRQAAMARENGELDTMAQREAMDGGGVPTGARQSSMAVEHEQPSADPTFDAAAASRYGAARAQTADLHNTFTNAPGVGEVLAPGRTATTFDLGLSGVPSAIFRGGKGAAERIQAFFKAGGTRGDLVSAIQEYAAFDLRRVAEDADGTINPAKHGAWMKSHAEAMAAFPELAEKFRTAAEARTALDGAVANRVAAQRAFEDSAARHFLGDGDPATAIGRILRSDNAMAQMQELARLTANDPAARAGLQRAVVDHILRDLRANTVDAHGLELLKNDAFQTFAKKGANPLSAIFSPEQIQSIRNVAADLQRANKSISATKLPGGSNTAQDLAEGEKHGGSSALTQIVIAESAGEMAGDLVGHAHGPIGALLRPVATLGALVANALRASGMKKVDELVAQAMLHPEIAKTLISKVPNAGSQKFIMQTLQRQMAALATKAATTNGRNPPEFAEIPQQPGGTPWSAPRVSAGTVQ